MICPPPGSDVCRHVPAVLGPLARELEPPARSAGWEGPLGLLAAEGGEGLLGGEGGVAGLTGDGDDTLDAAWALLIPKMPGDM